MKPSYLLFCINIVATSFAVSDLDTSGLSDIFESIYLGGPAVPYADADGDGVNNYDEMIWGTNPTNASSRVIGPTATLEGQDLRLNWPVAAHRHYQLEASSDLSVWKIVASGAIGSHLETIAGTGDSGHRFFRLSVTLPASTVGAMHLAGTVSGRDFTLTWASGGNRAYELQASSALPNWVVLSTNAISPYFINLDTPSTPYRVFRLRGEASGGVLEPWEEDLYRHVFGHSLEQTVDTDGDGLPDVQEFERGRNVIKKDHPAVGLVVFTPLEK